MRDMRNDAAHLALPFRFENPEYQIEKLFGPLSEKEKVLFDAFHRIGKGKQENHRWLRSMFEKVAASIYLRLNAVFESPESAALMLKRTTGAFDGALDELKAQLRQDKSASSDDSTSQAQT